MNDNVLLLNFGDTGNEIESIRQCLEQFGYNVLKCNIGRPNDFIKILSDDYFADYKYLIISCHGKDGEITMPQLHESIYTDKEPKNNFGALEIEKYIKIENKIIINTGCSTGQLKEMIAAFTEKNNTYIAPKGYPEGNSTLIFVINLFYHLKNKYLSEAFNTAKRIDEETNIFAIFKEEK